MIKGKIETILKTRHFKCDPNALVEVHTLTCHRHVFMYLLAIKSLLRFNGNVSVVAHDDGSLTKEDGSLLRKHIDGIRIIDRSFADGQINEILKGFPVLQEYRKNNLILLQVFDYAFFSRSDKIISLDSDTLFLKKPERLIEWTLNNNKEIVHLYDHKPHGQKKFLSKLGLNHSPHFCAGLFFYYKDILDLSSVEHLLGKVKHPDWYISQNILSVLIREKADTYRGHPLDKNEYQDGNSLKEGAVFRHYWSSVMGTRWYDPRRVSHKFNNLRAYHRDSKQILRELI